MREYYCELLNHLRPHITPAPYGSLNVKWSSYYQCCWRRCYSNN